MDRTGRYAIKKFGLKSVYTNFAKSINAVLKRLVEWDRRLVDCVIRALEMLCQYYVREIHRGHYRLGQYTIRSHLEHLYSLTKDVPMFPIAVAPPEDIVSQIKNSGSECKVRHLVHSYFF
jgi:hypothetical protein